MRTDTHSVIHLVSNLRQSRPIRLLGIAAASHSFSCDAAVEIGAVMENHWRLMFVGGMGRQLGVPEQSLVGQKRTNPEEGHNEVVLCLPQ